jgi:hypothetical protein
MSVLPVVRIEKLAAHWTDFQEILYWSIFRKYIKKIKVLLKPEKIAGTLHEDQYTFIIISRSIHLRITNVLDMSFRENKKTFCIQYPFFENCAFMR